MTQEVVHVDERPMTPAYRVPALSPAGNIGAISVEQERAIAEVRAQIMIAKHFPRDLVSAHAEIMETCRLPAMAEVAFFKVPRAGGTVSGPSIRLAEELVRVCGNIEYGHIELSRDDGKSEVEVYAWDKQTNTRRRRQITVIHVIDTRNGPKAIRDQKEIDDLIANKASKQMRGLMLSLIPPWLKQDAIDQCKRTLAGENGGESVAQRVRKMTQAFGQYGVTVEMLEKHVGHKLDATTLDELVEFTGIYNGLREGGKIADYFGANHEDSDAAAALAPDPSPADPKKPAAAKTEAKAQEKAKEPAPQAQKADAAPKQPEQAQTPPAAAPEPELPQSPPATAEPKQEPQASAESAPKSPAPAAAEEAVF